MLSAESLKKIDREIAKYPPIASSPR